MWQIAKLREVANELLVTPSGHVLANPTNQGVRRSMREKIAYRKYSFNWV